MHHSSTHRHLRGWAATAVTVALTTAGLSTAQAADDGIETVEGHVVRVLSEVLVPDTAGEVEETFIVDSATDEMIPVTLPDGADVDSSATVLADIDTATGTVVDLETVPQARVLESQGTGAHTAYVLAVGDDVGNPAVALDDAIADLTDAADYWVAQSRGAIPSFGIGASATVTWTSACLSYTRLWTEAKAQFPGIDFDLGTNHLVVYTPATCSYSYAGVATVPYGDTLWGGLIHIAEPGITVTAHELGHNMGLGHANLQVDVAPGETEVLEYYGVFSLQGAAFDGYDAPTLDAAWRDYLELDGHISQTRAATIDRDLPDSFSVTLSDVSLTSGTTAVKLTDALTGEETFIEYRSGVGADADAFYADEYPYLGAVDGLDQTHYLDYTPGVVISQLDRDLGELTFLTNEAEDPWDTASLLASETYTHPDGSFAVTVTSLDASTAVVSVQVGEVAGVSATTTTVSVPAVYQGTAPKASITVAADTTVSGKVAVYVDGAKYRTVALDTTGGASVALSSSLAVGSHTVRAVYVGSAAFGVSESTSTVKVKAKIASTTSATASTRVFGKAIPVVVSVPAAKGHGGKATVTFGSGRWTASVSPSTGKATLWMPKNWKPGTRTLTVTYAGTAAVKASTTTVKAVTKKATPSVKITSAGNIGLGKRATLKVAVTGPLTANEAGTLRAYVNGKAVSSTVTLTRSGSSYVASFKTYQLPKGQITLKYVSKNAFVTSRTVGTKYVVR
ncbi:Ig-like domain repeat protein [Demequina subtropica]|uniref:Ig-like domain repeat protein n=1 Tax=Demequina subtropica TaxID=1638989 RepID=UPI0007804BD3|nr:Ig-like domain repeat protein [Demequina subtropica]